MLLRDFLIVLLVFSAVVVGGANFLGELSANYAVNTTDVSSLSSIKQINDTTSKVRTQLETTDTSFNPFDAALVFFRGSIDMIKLMFYDIPGLWLNSISDIGALLHIPGWATDIFFLLTIITLLFVAAAVLLKWKV